MITTEYNELSIKERIQARTQSEWITLYAKRAILGTLNFCFNLACICAIVVSNINKKVI